MIKKLATLLLVGASTMTLVAGGTASAAPDAASEGVVAKADSKVLNYTWRRQETGYWCGPGSTQIALSTRISPPSQQTLANFMGTHTGGTDHIGLVRNALNHFLGTTWFEAKNMADPPSQAQRDLLRRDLVLNIDNNYPIVANVVSGWRPPGYPGGTIYHYVAVVGYRAGGAEALIADPAGEGSGGSGWANVPRAYWISTHNLGTWIGGKGYAA
ncbi:C39 family peptidase [Allokutzneria albata]|uniref:Peptidase_C39 like family protein n=1 Tax=Allokutzneria albata TaxID=211114 RepID=A0A1H0BTA1_ALLAB|nr:C39 family peptidase [Allokutzneria albata]SDN48879.1 Peptidase_C39 like family protein [Allokutzneria albata]